MPENITQTAIELASTWGVKVVGAIAVLVVGLIVAKVIRGSVRKTLTGKIDDTLVPFVSNLVYYILLAVVVIAVLELFGVQTASLVAVLGALAFAVGLALQGTLSNFAAGVMLLIFRPFRVGDFVNTGGESGSVQEIGIFTTVLHTPDNIRIIIPNSAVFSNTIKNITANDTRRVDMVFGVGYDDDLDLARKTILGIIEADNRVLKEPAPVVEVSELGDSSVNFVVRPWVKKEDYWGLYFHLNKSVKVALEQAGCSIPFPQRDVHLFQESSS